MATEKTITPPRINVLDGDSIVIGHLPARVGLRTYRGKITRFTEKTVWVETKDGREVMCRAYDGGFPATYRQFVRKDEVTWLNKPTPTTGDKA